VHERRGPNPEIERWKRADCLHVVRQLDAGVVVERVGGDVLFTGDLPKAAVKLDPIRPAERIRQNAGEAAVGLDDALLLLNQDRLAGRRVDSRPNRREHIRCLIERHAPVPPVRAIQVHD